MTDVPEFRKPMPEASADFMPLSCNQIFGCSNSVPLLFPLQEGKSCDEAFDSDDDDLTSSLLASPHVLGTDGFFSAGAEKAGCCLFRNPIKMCQSKKSPRISSSMLGCFASSLPRHALTRSTEKLSTHAISEESVSQMRMLSSGSELLSSFQALSVADTPSGKDFRGRDSPYSERSTEEGKDSSISEGAASNDRNLHEEQEDGSEHDNNLRSESWISRDSQQVLSSTPALPPHIHPYCPPPPFKSLSLFLVEIPLLSLPTLLTPPPLLTSPHRSSSPSPSSPSHKSLLPFPFPLATDV